MDVQIIDADLTNPAHRAGIVDVLNAYACDPAGGAEPLSAEVRQQLVRGLEAHPTSVVLLAIADQRPIGIAVCFLGFSTFRARPLLNIHDLAVLRQWRGRGVGRALLGGAQERARRRGCCRLTLEVQDDNRPALALYRQFGFDHFVVGQSAPTRFLVKPLDLPVNP